MISVTGITKTYGDFTAVNNISFEIRDGEITGLLGPNGAGKTTTLRMLTCYFNPDSGTIQIGENFTDQDSLLIKKRIGYLPESAPIYNDMIVYDYLKYIMEIHEIESEDRLMEMAELCGIKEVMHKSVSELSKGYKQRVGLAHAMIHDPDILILDEPTSGLDPNQIIEIRNLIKEIGKKKTIILSTHILSEVEATCDRVIIINKGNIVADDKTENLQVTDSSEDKISILVKGAELDSLKEKIKSIDGVKDIYSDEDGELLSLEITSSMENDIRPEIFKIVSENNWILYEMKREQKSLENVFRELTIGEDNE